MNASYNIEPLEGDKIFPSMHEVLLVVILTIVHLYFYNIKIRICGIIDNNTTIHQSPNDGYDLSCYFLLSIISAIYTVCIQSQFFGSIFFTFTNTFI